MTPQQQVDRVLIAAATDAIGQRFSFSLAQLAHLATTCALKEDGDLEKAALRLSVVMRIGKLPTGLSREAADLVREVIARAERLMAAEEADSVRAAAQKKISD